MVQTPVLFETFVRVEYARQVFEAIKKAKPRVLYFYSNKGRIDHEGEIEKNNEIRSWTKEIDWDCELHTWFREECVDVYTSLRGAISWLFENETSGIILEDDTVPTPAFFSFCDQIIERYKDEKKVWCISGDNYVPECTFDADFSFSHYHSMYGWATWKDRWDSIPWAKIPVEELLDLGKLSIFYKSKKEARDRIASLKKNVGYINDKMCWDYAFGATIDLHSGVTVIPKEHLVTNVGLQGMHSRLASKAFFHIDAKPSGDYYEIKRYPTSIEANFDYDHAFFAKSYKYSKLYKRVYRRLIALLSGIIHKG